MLTKELFNKRIISIVKSAEKLSEITHILKMKSVLGC